MRKSGKMIIKLEKSVKKVRKGEKLKEIRMKKT